jgi:hypothetical protein
VRSRSSNTLLGLCCMAATLVLQADVKVSTEQDPAADLAALRSYRWLPTPQYLTQAAPEARDPGLSQKVLDAPIRAAVDRALADKRFKQAGSTASPDFHVVYYAAVGVGMNTGVLGAHYGYTTGWGTPIVGATPTTAPKMLEEGTLVIDILRSDRAKAIWRGTATGAVDRTKTEEERRRTIETAVQQMFATFPRSR